MQPRFLPAGDTALVVEFGERIDRAISRRVLALAARLRATCPPGVTETVPTYRSLLVHFDPLVTDSIAVTAAIRSLTMELDEIVVEGRLWRLPACYALPCAPDLEDVARCAQMSVDEVIRIHTDIRFHVYMIGFVPGFPYMGDLPETLRLPRRTDPRVRVPAGSIAIAIGQTAIYPVESPGGWHLIGATPVRLFDPRLSRPALLEPGDQVLFEPVSQSEYETIAADVSSGTYRPHSEALAA